MPTPGLNDNGYFLVSRTVVYTAAVDTAAPDAATLDSPAVAWTILGHIGDETADGNVTFTKSGGDVTTKGSITKKSIRQFSAPVFSGIEFDVSQLTRDVLALYHGTAGGTAPTVMKVEGQSDGVTTERACLVVWEDGTRRVALYAPRGSFSGRDSIDTTSIEDAVRVPLQVGFLDSSTLTGPNTKPLRYSWISPDLLAIS